MSPNIVARCCGIATVMLAAYGLAAPAGAVPYIYHQTSVGLDTPPDFIVTAEIDINGPVPTISYQWLTGPQPPAPSFDGITGFFLDWHCGNPPNTNCGGTTYTLQDFLPLDSPQLVWSIAPGAPVQIEYHRSAPVKGSDDFTIGSLHAPFSPGFGIGVDSDHGCLCTSFGTFVAAVPEPQSMAVLLIGVFGLAALRRSRAT